MRKVVKHYADLLLRIQSKQKKATSETEKMQYYGALTGLKNIFGLKKRELITWCILL